MFFPEFLYQLSARDQQITWLDPVIRNLDVSVAAVVVNADAFLANDRALILTNAVVNAFAGAAQTSDNTSLFLIPPGSSISIGLRGERPAAAANVILNWVGQVLVPPGWTLRGAAAFNAGVAANRVVFDFAGMLIPVGNIQRV